MRPFVCMSVLRRHSIGLSFSQCCAHTGLWFTVIPQQPIHPSISHGPSYSHIAIHSSGPFFGGNIITQGHLAASSPVCSCFRPHQYYEGGSGVRPPETAACRNSSVWISPYASSWSRIDPPESQLDIVRSLLSMNSWVNLQLASFRVQIRHFIDASVVILFASAWCKFHMASALSCNLFVPFWEHLPRCASHRLPYFLLFENWSLYISICTIPGVIVNVSVYVIWLHFIFKVTYCTFSNWYWRILINYMYLL